ncbi:MAG: TraR/DksA C4-type zinc finger protein [Dehalococcoidales bacterium]|nr:TraR/DksA C4-type zinc finger protein [Dehalococcoidales bacterium]
MKANFKQLRSRLENEKKHVLEEIAQLQASAQPTEVRREGSPFGKREEEAIESLELERRLTMEKQMKEQLADIEYALSKFEKGTYGLCDSCGQPIAPGRLEVLPQANLCVNCKEKNAKGRVFPR